MYDSMYKKNEVAHERFLVANFHSKLNVGRKFNWIGNCKSKKLAELFDEWGSNQTFSRKKEFVQKFKFLFSDST